MIKLNNKNITYVALADSNNSLKAPKEIWYADSNNSVKLVYRRKDALIEGEDYEKYHWLGGDGNSYIDTLIGDLTNVSTITCHFFENNLPLSENRIFGREGNATYDSLMTCGLHNAAQKLTVWIRPNPSFQLDVNKDGDYIEIDLVNRIASSSLQSYSFDSSPNLKGRPLYLFGDNGYNKVFAGRIKSFIIGNKINLIPCKLLKPLPKWLDANGIRRQVGECGMIDLVSGKFYGNVNSVGTFTVENYYERKEWLVGDGSAYIDTNIIVDVPSLYISTSFTKKVGDNTPLFGSRDIFSSNGSQIWYLNNGNLRFDIITNRANWIFVDSSDIQNINQLIVDCPNKVININEITLSSGVDDLSIKNSSNTFKIYSLEILNSSDSNNVPYHGAFSNFTLNDSTHSLNLIPCTLTMDLPASMDANNIARTKGTSGMWDLVSDKFYGNVANSGTFKAVNLAEGVDYEVHQWLKTGSGNPYIQVANEYNTDNDAYLETTFKGASVNGASDIILGFGSDNSFGYRIFVVGQTVHLDIHKRVNGVLASKRINIQSPPYQVCHILLNSNRYEFNGVSNTYELGGGFDTSTIQKHTRIFTNQNNNDMHYAETKLRVNNVEYDLIPVKLLRSIPSKYDANGIARQAGECGMYDTVNDLFYGNVASSGSFTVEDDN